MVSRPIPRRRTRRPRRDERGVAVFVVLLVITLLGGIGVYASQAASQTIQSIGYTRQNAQNHYVAEYAMQAALMVLGMPGNCQYINQAGATCDANANGTNTTCAHIVSSDVATLYNANGKNVFDAPTVTGGVMTAPGSLGPVLGSSNQVALLGSFDVQITDAAPASGPYAGMPLNQIPGGGSNPAVITGPFTVVLTASGTVQPSLAALCGASGSTAATTAGTLGSTLVAGTESIRAFTTVTCQ